MRRFVKSLSSRALVCDAFGSGERTTERALIYYKTDFFNHRYYRRATRHSNVWEVGAMAHLLAAVGYSVDVIDRTFSGDLPRPPYSLFVGLGSGYSGRNFAKWALRSEAPHRLLLATGPEPQLSDQLVNDQYRYFDERHGTTAPPMRTFPNLPFPEFVTMATGIVAIGESDQFCVNSYIPLELPVTNFLPGVTGQGPQLEFEVPQSARQDQFLCFAGNGFICKGVDLVVEAFLETPELNLTVCGPATEEAFFRVLGPRIERARNIAYLGFVPAFSKRYFEIVSRNAFTILASSSEGCATSVATNLTSGLVPIVTPETGINIGEFGFLVDAPRRQRIEQIKDLCRRAANESHMEYRARSEAAYESSTKYTTTSYYRTMQTAIGRQTGSLIDDSSGWGN